MLSTSIITGPVKPEILIDETLADIFYESAGKYTSKTAIIFGDTAISYTELDQWSNAVALFLIENGIGSGDKVGIWWPRGLELHVAILGIIKAGAAYVPLDREMPAERVELVMKEVGASACFCNQQINAECLQLQVPQKPQDDFEMHPPLLAAPDHSAYVLYTSGSTGKPKGIPISHRQICHLVRAEQSIFNINATDRVYQGFSVSFDMWCEETWISFLAGATLWVADIITSKAIDELSSVLNAQQITILHAVPSLLAVMDNRVPSLRLINAGGEACTPQVLARWSAEGRRFFNSYGPTETTVTATMAQLNPGDNITIGIPLPNYNLAVVDEQLNPLPIGERGELIISGPGVSDGYINLPELTAEKFVMKPDVLSMLLGDRLYRTGDAAVINADGSIDFLGRFDDQIKLRGYRIELGEIESCLNGLQGISAAAVAVKKDSNDQDQLVGYIVADGSLNIDLAFIRMELSKVLPAYMVPGTISILKEMPRMPSGKVNRKALPTPESMVSSIDDPADTIDINASIPDRVLAVLRKTFPGREIDLSLDFFTDLGGHSLLAAAFVSRLRNDCNIPNASLKDVYTYRPLSKLVSVWESAPEPTAAKTSIFNKIPQWRYLMCWLAQSVSLLLIYGLFAVQIFIPYLGYYYVREATGSLPYGIITAIGMYCLVPPLLTTLSVLTKWLIIGKMRAGDYPLWGTYYFRWWFVRTMQSLIPTQFMNGTPIYPLYLRMMGVKVAKDAQLSAITMGAEDLISIGSDVSLSSQVILNNAVVEDGFLKLRSIKLEDHSYIGSSAILGGDTIVKEWGELQDLSSLPPGQTIGSCEVWKGSPAQFIEKRAIADLPIPLFISAGKRGLYRIIFSALLIIFPIIILIPLLPTILALHALDNAAADYNFSYMIVVPVLATTYIIFYAFETILLTRLLQRGIKPGKHSIYSGFYIKKWLADQLMSLSLIVMHPIFATVFVAPFFRLLGAKVGKNTEISTASNVTHPLLEIGDGAFVADAVTLGESDVRGQQLILDITKIADKSFVGNSALIPQGYHLPGNMLIGVLSTPPDAEQLKASDAKDWFGSPAIALPRRQESNPFPDELTTSPSFSRRMARTFVEFIRIITPETAIICFSILFIAYGHDLITQKPLWQILLFFPFYYLGLMGIPSFLITVILKWVLIGKYKARQSPMWTWDVWRSEAVTSTYEALSAPFLLEYLKGTPWLPLALRLLGVKTGKRVWMNTTDITEYDMVSIGDDTALNEDCGPQTHLFEDRVMKVGAVKIGARTSIGARSIILYDSEIGNDVKLGALSLVMKGEVLAAGTSWTGSPVKPN